MTVSDNDLELVDEYVLGLLSEDQERAVVARLAAEPDLAAAIEAARERFLPLDATARPLEPSDGLWPRIAAAIAMPAATRPTAPRPAQPRRTTPRRAAPRAAPGPGRSPDHTALRLSALGGLAASLIMAAALVWSLVLRPGPEIYAGLINDAGELIALIESSSDNRVRVILLDDVTVDEGRVLEVWTQPDPDGAPISVGIIEALASQTLTLAGYPPPADDQFYAISLEQTGGSPTGLPTGPIIGKGYAREPL